MIPRRNKLLVAAACAAAAASLAPAAAQAGTAVSSLPNLPSGARAGGSVLVGEAGLPGLVTITQIFNGADFGATARVRQIRLSLNCGPGPSVGNPGGSGPAINDPEVPCTNPDAGVFGALSQTGVGTQACAGTTFAITAPDSQGQVDLIPNFPLYLRNAETCEIGFTFTVLRSPLKDTFPNAAGMQTTSVSAVRSEIVSDPGNPSAVGLQAAGLGSGDAVLISPPDCTATPTAAECNGVKSKKAAPAGFKFAAACVTKRIRASVSGDGISKVTYSLGSQTLGVVKGASPFKLNVAARNLLRGKPRLTATIDFKSKATPATTVSKRLARCRAPNFTG